VFAPVIGFGWYHPANPAARVRNIPAVSRNQVNVRMVDRLPGRSPVVDSDVERFSSLFLEKDRLANAIIFQISATSSADNSKMLETCRRGTMSVCPLVTG